MREVIFTRVQDVDCEMASLKRKTISAADGGFWGDV